MMNNPYQQYKEQALNTLTPGELLVKLFDETVKQLNIAKFSIQKKNYAVTNESLNKAQTIIGTLNSSLDMNYQVSEGLRDMYIFLAQQINAANMRKDAKIVTDILPLVKELRDSFEQANIISRKTSYGNVGRRAAV